MKKENRNLIFSFIAGAAAGVAIGTYINSEKGQEQISQAKETINEAESVLSEELKKQIAQINEGFSELSAKVQSQLLDLKTQSQQLIQNGKDEVA